jgi:hypothetical protein
LKFENVFHPYAFVHYKAIVVPNFKGEAKLMNNFNDNKGQIRVQGPSISTCILLTNHVITPPPNLSTPKNNSMVMSKLNSFKLKEKIRTNKKLLYNVICHFSNKEGMHFGLSLLLHSLSPLNNCTLSLKKTKIMKLL